ncbi:MAG: hypothetical protein PF961_18935 [Planctomycetota bacterium]|jgi:hypothetical protein|nr:hypothetical protein [Planctomycetota bacterium]
MATLPVRKFAISIDPEEVVDFEEPLAYFEEVFAELHFEQVGNYKFRYADREATITGELSSSRDGYELWMLVQAPDEHEYRIAEVADAFAGHVISSSGTRSWSSGSYSHRS